MPTDVPDLVQWLMQLLQIRDDKIAKLSEIVASQQMAMKILGAAITALFAAFVTFLFSYFGGKP